MTSDISILLIEKDKTIRTIIKKFLEKKEYKLELADSFNDSLKAIISNNFNVVIISDSVDSIEFETIVNKVKTSYPDTILILLLKEVSTSTFIQNTMVFYKPVNLLKLEDTIKEKLKNSIHFNFKNQDLFNFINQNVKLNQNLLISILDPASRKLGLIYLNGFNFIHSEYDDLIGEEAFYFILELDQGLVSYFEGIEPPVITMNFALNNSNSPTNEVYKKEEFLNTNSISDKNVDVPKSDSNKVIQNENYNKEIPPLSDSSLIVDIDQKLSKVNDNLLDSFVDKVSPVSTTPSKVDYSGKKILIVDDDITSRKINSEIFKSNGFLVFTSDSALDAKELMQKGEVFDFVVTDLNMPNLNGIEFLIWLKDKFPKIKVIVISGFVSEKIEDFIQKKGVIKYFKKPIKAKELNEFISTNMLSKDHEIVDIEKINILEFIELIVLSNQKNIISIKNTDNNKVGYIYIEHDKILHAKYENIVGPDAFYQIMEIKHGKFDQIPWAQPKEITINASIDVLMKAKDILKKDEIIKFMENKLDDKKDSFASKNKNNIQKILIVDDETSSIKILSSYLQKKGYQTQVTDSALKGIELLKKESFDVVITDVNMPEMNGIEFLLWIKQYFHKIKVIMITAFGSEVVKSLSSQKGAFYFFDKPINFKEMDYLLSAIHSSENFTEDINLIDFIKLSAVSKANKLISVTSLLTNNTGHIYLSHGNFLHVEFANFKGQEALEKILTTNNLIFSEVTWVSPPEKNLDMDAIKALEDFSNKVENKQLTYDTVQPTQIKETATLNPDDKNLELYVKQKELLTQIEKETDPIKKLTIYESGICMGIIVGSTNKEQTLKIMANFSKENMLSQKDSKMLIYDDISVTILFDDDNIVQEINFGKFFKGKTSKGIQLDDFMKKGFDLYGKPDMCTLKGAVWKNVSLFSFDGKFVTSIRLRPLI